MHHGVKAAGHADGAADAAAEVAFQVRRGEGFSLRLGHAAEHGGGEHHAPEDEFAAAMPNFWWAALMARFIRVKNSAAAIIQAEPMSSRVSWLRVRFMFLLYGAEAV